MGMVSGGAVVYVIPIRELYVASGAINSWRCCDINTDCGGGICIVHSSYYR